MQEVHLDKHIKLLDSPGIVMATGTSDTSVILRNCVKVCCCSVIGMSGCYGNFIFSTVLHVIRVQFFFYIYFKEKILSH